MRIGIDAHAIGSKTPQGGNETYWSNLLLKLSEVGDRHEFYVFTSGKSWLEKALCTKPNFQFHIISNSPAKRVLYEFNAMSKIFNLDLLHATYYGALTPKIPMVLTVHDMAYFRLRKIYSSSKYSVLRALIKNSILEARAVITVSHFSKDEIIDLMRIDERRVKVIHNGVDNYERQISSLRANTIDGHSDAPMISQPYVLYVGNIEPRKNLTTLVKAFKVLEDRFRVTHTLVIAGKSQEQYLRRLRTLARQLNMEGRIVFPGRIPDSKLSQLISGSALFVYPSTYEGFGFPPFEALGLGVPTVVAEAGAMPEVLGDAALFFHLFDYHDLAEKMYEVLTNQALRDDLVTKGNLQINKFSWLETAKKLLKVYEEVIW